MSNDMKAWVVRLHDSGQIVGIFPNRSEALHFGDVLWDVWRLSHEDPCEALHRGRCRSGGGR